MAFLFRLLQLFQRPPLPATAVPVNPSTGQVYTSSINPSKQLNLNVYNAAPLIDHIANNQLTSNQDFNNVLSIVSLLPTAAQTESSFHQVIAEPYASILGVTLEALNTFRQACFRASGSGKSINLPEDERWSVFTDVGNTQASMSDPSNGLSSFDYNVFQSILGVEYAVTKDFSTGVVMGYGFNQAGSFEYNQANLYANNLSVGLLEKYHPGNFRFTGLVAYSNFQYSSTREINFGSPSAGYVDRQAHGHGVVHGFQSFWLEGDRIFSGRVWRSDVDRKTASLKSLFKRGGEAGKYADRGEKE